MKKLEKPKIDNIQLRITYDIEGDSVEITQSTWDDDPIKIRFISQEENLIHDEDRSRDSLMIIFNSTDELRSMLNHFDKEFIKLTKSK